MRAQPFSKADTGRIVPVLKAGKVWQGSRQGLRIRLYRVQRAEGPRIEAQICKAREWRTLGAGTVAEALDELNQQLFLLRYERRAAERRAASARP